MDLPKKARTADWQDGFLILDGEKKFKVPELSIELMERLAGFSLVGFHVKNYPFNDDLLKPFFRAQKHGQLWGGERESYRRLFSRFRLHAQTALPAS